MNSAIGSLAHFSKDRTYRMLMLNANKLMNLFGVLLNCLENEEASPPITRFSSICMINKLLVDKELINIKQMFIKEGILTFLVRALRDSQTEIKKESINAVIQLCKLFAYFKTSLNMEITVLASYLEIDASGFRPLIRPLINCLSDDSDALVIKSLTCLKIFSYKDLLIEALVSNGITSILCSFLMEDLTTANVNKAILIHSLQLLLLLIQNEEARNIMYETSIILSVLSFLVRF